MIDMNELSKRAHSLALEKGWYDAERPEGFNATGFTLAYVQQLERRRVAELLMLVCTEITEAWEDYQHVDINLRYNGRGKPCGMASELADVIIRIADMAGYLNIELTDKVAVDYPSVGFAILDMYAGASHACECARANTPIAASLGVMVRICEWIAKEVGINLEEAVEAKMAFNATRPRRHGKAF